MSKLLIFVLLFSLSSYASKSLTSNSSISKIDTKVNCQVQPLNVFCWNEGEKAYKNNNFELAKKYFEPRCDKNDFGSCHLLGIMYHIDYNKLGSLALRSKAIEFYSKACNISKDSVACKDLARVVSCKKNPC
jgi:hypothetical protein